MRITRTLRPTTRLTVLTSFMGVTVVMVFCESTIVQAAIRGDLRTVALSGIPAPSVSGATFNDLTWSGPTISPNGVVVFPAILQGSTTNTGIFTGVSPGTLSLVALQGANAPGSSSQFLTGTTSDPINLSNEIAAAGLLTNGQEGIWIGHPAVDTVLALTGTPAPLPGGVLFGQITNAFSGYTPVPRRVRRRGISNGLADQLGPAHRRCDGRLADTAWKYIDPYRTKPEDPSVDSDPTATFTSLGTPGIALDGLAAFSGFYNDPLAGVVGGSGIWSGASGFMAPIANTGMPAIGVPNAVFETVGYRATTTGTSVHTNVFDNTIFFATLSGPNIQPGVNDHGVWVGGNPFDSALVARQGNQAPGLPAGTTFTSFTDSGLGKVLAAVLAQVSGPGITTANNTGIWEGVPGNLHLVARNGDPISDGANPR